MDAPVRPAYRHTPLFALGEDRTTYRKLDRNGVRIERALGRGRRNCAPNDTRTPATGRRPVCLDP